MHNTNTNVPIQCHRQTDHGQVDTNMTNQYNGGKQVVVLYLIYDTVPQMLLYIAKTSSMKTKSNKRGHKGLKFGKIRERDML